MTTLADQSLLQIQKPEAPAVVKGSESTSAEPARKLKAFRIRAGAARQLAIMGAEIGISQQDLVAEALNLLFERHGKELIA